MKKNIFLALLVLLISANSIEGRGGRGFGGRGGRGFAGRGGWRGGRGGWRGGRGGWRGGRGGWGWGLGGLGLGLGLGYGLSSANYYNDPYYYPYF